MHTVEIGEFSVNYNSDYSGDIIFLKDGVDVAIPFTTLKRIVANKLRMDVRDKSEAMSDDEILRAG